MRHLAPTLLTLTLLCALPGGARGEDPFADDPLDPGPTVETLIRRYAQDEASLRSFTSVPLSKAHLERMEAFTGDRMSRAVKVLDDASLTDRAARVDALLLLNLMKRRAHDIRFRRTRMDETLELLPFAPELAALEEARRRMEPVDAREAATRLAALKTEVDGIRKRVESGLKKTPGDDALRPSKVVAFRTAGAIDRLIRTQHGWFTFRDGYEPDFGWWVRKPHGALRKALEAYRKVLREKVAGVKEKKTAPLIGDPIGRDELVAALGFEFIPYKPEQLVKIAEREFAWCDAEGEKASRELGFDGDWKKAVEHVKGLHVPPGEQDDLVARQGKEAIAFVEHLVTIPTLARETWKVEMIGAERQKVLPFAAYSGQSMWVAYPTAGMDHDAKLMSMRGNNEHFTRIVTPHELIPGHHLQGYMADRHRDYRKLFRTPFLVEGWALHWEMLLWDEGYPRNAADRVGMLFWRKHRCARIIVSLGFHLGTMEPDAMIDFLVDRVGLERDGATSEVRRYIAGSYGPLYQCAYMIGGLQLRALRLELVGAGTMTDKQFHDAVLRENSIPIELIRASLTGVFPNDLTSTWKFAGEIE